jgi:hypothetical protein
MKQTFLGMTVWVHHKGGSSKEEMNRANDLEAARNQMLQSSFNMALQRYGVAQPLIEAQIQNRGMLPETEAAMRSQALQGLGQQYSNLQGQLSQQLAARGLTGGQFGAGGGAVAKGFGELGALEAGQQSNLLNQIQMAKAQNLNNVLGMELGSAGQLQNAALGFGQQGVGALGIGQQAAQAAEQASTGFWGSVIGGLAGLGTAGIGKIPCWVAAELYGGWLAPEVSILRHFIFGTWWMKPFAWLYMQFGERWAKHIRHAPRSRYYTKKLFNWFLAHG